MPEPFRGDVRLEGRGVRLEPLGPEHVDGLLAAADDPEIWEWLSFEIHDHPSALAFLQTARDFRTSGYGYTFAVVERDTGRLIGSTSYVDIRPRDRAIEIGYTWYSRAVWGTDVNPECKYLLMRHAFEEWGADRVALKTDIRNLHSQAAIRKLGARDEGQLRYDRIRRDGSHRDTMVFSVIRPEWPDVRAGLLERLG